MQRGRARIRLVACAAILGAAALTLVSASAVAGQTGAQGSQPDLGGSGVSGTGLLPNFAAQGTNLIRLQAGAFDPLSSPLPAGAGFPLVNPTTLAAATPQYWLVQVKGTDFLQVTNAVTAGGGQIVGSLPDRTYIVRATTAQSSLIAGSSSVRWIGFYQPAWRAPVAAAGKQGIVDLTGGRVYRVHVFRGEPDPAGVVKALRAISGVQVVSDSATVVDLRATAAQLPQIAAISGVEWVAVEPRTVLLNANARWVNDTGVRDVYNATAPGHLTGAGQTAADADTGLNYTYDLNGRAHVAFRDCAPGGLNCKQAIYTSGNPGGTATADIENVVNNNTGHRKMVAYFDLGGTGPNMFDESSHGSHTAGSIDGDQPPYGTYTGNDGLAPGAMHVHENIADSGGGLGGQPDTYYDLFRLAYEPRNPAQVESTSGNTGNPNGYCTFGTGSCRYKPTEDARTHNNSYGLIAPIIDDGEADQLDEFVWDHEDMTIVVSAGNAGPVPASIGTPSVAKNELSSGAGANGRQPMVSIDSVAVFSSHGPTGDGRLGPDLITPGQVVVSVKGGSTDGYHVAQGTSMSAPVLTGLSTLVRQYYYDGYAAGNLGSASVGGGFAGGAANAGRRHNPSAALVKATLVNGAVRMRGYYSGLDGDNRALDGQWPSEGQGFGRVNLDNSLYFTNDPSNLWYMDVYRGDTANSAGCLAAGGTLNSSCTSFAAGANASRSFQVHVAPGQPLDVTLAWADFASGLAAGTPALVNNLDLTVTGPGGTTYAGNNMNSRTNPGVAVAETMNAPGPADTKNNVERVRVANPPAGDYTITVSAPAIAQARQGFALAASGNISKVGGPAFVPGPPLQVDAAGSPQISNVNVKPSSAETVKVTFDTNEPTTATADANVVGGLHTFIDSYNLGSSTDWPGLNIGPVETSADYANKPVVGTHHEILVTGFSPGQLDSILLKAKDLGNNEVSQAAPVQTPSTVFQPDALDTAQLYEDPQTSLDPRVAEWQTGTQLYASNDGAGGGVLGAFMFRAPETAFDPADITGAAVELTSTHNWTIPYIGDPQLMVDLLNPSVEPNWGTQMYSDIENAASDARVPPESTHLRGDYQRYDFTFKCSDLPALQNTLAASGGERDAAFRYDATVATPQQLFAMEFGFNRRSRGPDLRPKLILQTNGDPNPTGEPCDPNTPAPTISSIGIHDGVQPNSVTVSWETDVNSDSFVIFRDLTLNQVGWTQVGSWTRTKIHHVQVFGLNSNHDYEFVVRSAACNGATTTDTNQGHGYDFFYPPTPILNEYFTGVPQDQANKVLGSPTATFSTAAPNAAAPIVQGSFATFPNPNNSFHESHGTYWDGVVPNTLGPGTKITFHFFASSVNGQVFVTSPHLTLFKNGTAFHQEDVGFTVGAPLAPVDNKITVTLGPSETIAAGQTLSIQLAQTFVNNDWQIYYGDPADPSGWSIVLGTPPSLPLAGPVPPPSAGDTGLAAPELRRGPASADDVAAGTGVCGIPQTTATADVEVTKSDSPDPVSRGGQLTYTITVKNHGPDAAQDVQVSDPLPNDVTFVSASSTKGTCSGTSTVTCALGTLTSGELETVTIQVKVKANAPPQISNTATATSTTDDPHPENNSATEATTVNQGTTCPGPQIVDKTGDAPNEYMGGDHANMDNLDIVNASFATPDASSLQVTMTINNLSAPPPPTNMNSILWTTYWDYNGVTYFAQAAVNGIGQPMGGVYAYFVGTYSGGNYTYTDDSLLGNVTGTATEGPNGTLVITFPRSDVGSPADGATLTNTFADTHGSIGLVGNGVFFTAAADRAPDAGAGADYVVGQTCPPPTSADLQVTKTDNPDPVTAGGTLTYTIDVKNNGPDPAQNVQLTDPLPSDVSFIDDATTQGTCTGTTTVNCSLGAIGSGATATVTIHVTVHQDAPSTISNTATASSPTPDEDPTNNSSTAGTRVLPQPPPSADLSLTKSDSPDPVNRGGTLTYTIGVHNGGPDPAQSVQVSDTLPAGVTYQSATPSQGSCSGTITVMCSLGTLANGANATVTIVLTVNQNAPSTLSNTATVSSNTNDPNTSNNSATAETTVNTQQATSADLSVTKSDSPDPVDAGGTLTYTIVVKNNGPDTAQNVHLTDPLPADVSWQSTSTTTGTCTGTATVTCDLGNMSKNQTATVTIVVTVHSNAPSSISNTASASATTSDPNSGNNFDSETTSVRQPPPPSADLSVTKSDSPDPVDAGGTLTYTIVVKNNGPDTAQNVHLTDPLPADVSWQSTSTNTGTCTGTATVTCDLGNMSKNQTATVTIVVTVHSNAPSSISNTASVFASTGDPHANNNASTATTTVRQPSQMPGYSAITSDFNGTPIAGGKCIWFNSVLKIVGTLPSSQRTVSFKNSMITFSANNTSYNLMVPDGKITFDPNAGTATITYSSGWSETVPMTGENVFLTGLKYMVPAGGLPGGIKPVTWSGNFSSDGPLQFNWQWAAAVYTGGACSADYNQLGVKPVHSTSLDAYHNGDQAGTPENFKSSVIGGARGGGGSNYTGSYSGTAQLKLN